jgi:acetyl-CoA carboxylase carboxyl transferase subunit beta
MQAQARMPREPKKPEQPLPGAPDLAPPIDTGEVGDMSWLQKLMPSRIRTEGTSKGKVPEGLW